MNGNNDANALVQRQVLGGILTDILGGAETIVSDVGNGVTSAIGGVTSAVGPVLSPILPTSTSASSTPPPRTTSSTAPTVLPTTTNITPSSSSSSSSTSTFDRSSTSSTPTTSSSSPTSSATPTSESVFETVTTSNGQRQTVFVTQQVAPTETASPPPTHKSFLQNKPLSGFVFALAGIVALVIIILVATFTLRRQRRKKLTTEALSYEPTSNYNDDMEQRLTDEKNRTSYSSGGGGSVHGYYGPTGGPYDQNRMGGSQGAGVQYPNYAPRSPNPVYDRSYGTNANVDYPSYAPRSPNPAYDAYAGGVPQLPQLNVIGATPIPSSVLSGNGPVQPSNTPSPPPAAVTPLTRVPSPPQLPVTFGNGSNGSIDERPQYFGTDLKVANQ